MKKRVYYLIAALSVCIITSISLHNCATIIQSTCALEDFDGTFIGSYNVGGIFVVPEPDTIVIEVDISSNSAKITSVALDTFFVANFSDANFKLIIPALAIPVFEFNEIALEGIEISGGFLNLDSGCDKLFVQMNGLNVEDHNVNGLPKPIRNLDLSTPSFMTRQ